MPNDKPTQTDTPPIQDTIKDGKLTGQELTSQMLAEEEKGDERTPNEKVHGVLESIGIRDLAEQYNTDSLLGINDGNELPKWAAKIEDAFHTHLDAVQQFIKAHPKDYKQLIAERAKAEMAQIGVTPVQAAVATADLNNFIAFAETLDKTFPNGVHIEPEHVLGILAHFGKIGIPPASLEKSDKTDFPWFMK